MSPPRFTIHIRVHPDYKSILAEKFAGLILTLPPLSEEEIDRELEREIAKLVTLETERI